MILPRLQRPCSLLVTAIRYNHRTVPYPDLTHPEKPIQFPKTHEEKLALHLERPRFVDEYSVKGPPVGRVYEKIPFKYRVEKGRAYLYCACGWAHTQPFCDGMCKAVWGNHDVRRNPKFRPIKYVADETKDVWWCNCKQSSKRPFCDGTHRSALVQKQQAICTMSQSSMPPDAMFMTASQKPIVISSTSMQRAEQIMSQAVNKLDADERYFHDNIDDDELCRAGDQCDQFYHALQSQTSQESVSPMTGMKRKRLGVSTTPKERRAMIKRS